ncbi:MAG: STAS domain-containing protein [Proteobacteria bacterium]|nr:STAS domain-containing protein [Pseudomonadota bacterium]MBU1688767.1 STAS domain-containing protein [Pseudomonadota bacterium]
MTQQETVHSPAKFLALRGDFTIGRAAEFTAMLRTALESGSPVTLDVQAVVEVDLTFMQLLCAAHRTACELNTTVTISSPWPESVAQQIEQAGFTNRRCPFKLDPGCLWHKEGFR